MPSDWSDDPLDVREVGGSGALQESMTAAGRMSNSGQNSVISVLMVRAVDEAIPAGERE